MDTRIDPHWWYGLMGFPVHGCTTMTFLLHDTSYCLLVALYLVQLMCPLDDIVL